ncbi:MAG: AI-2E family transporter [Candidatus Pacebacteria bacterium]|nr:AI-2E family transporter [Candidatus Paceibacterota bacterium]
MDQKIVKIDITWRAIIRVFVFSLFVFSLFYFSQILLWVFLALIISLLFNPIIDAIEKKKISRPIAGALVYGFFVGIIILVILSIFPPLIQEMGSLANSISYYTGEFINILDVNGFNITNIGNVITIFEEHIMSFAQNTIAFAGGVIEQIFAFVTVFTIALFLSIEKEFPINFIKIFTVKEETEKKVLNTFNESQRQVIGYFNAKLVASIFVAIATAIFLSIIHTKYALLLGIISGIFNIIPIMGPVLSCLLIVFFAAFDSWIKALVVIAFCIILQQIESNLLVPILTKKIIGIPTVLVLVSVLIGAKLGGIMGAIFIIPVAGIAYEFTQKYFEKKKERVRNIS